MKTLRVLLRESDPVAREPGLTPDEIDRMRRAVLAATPPDRSTNWTARVAVAAALSLAAGVGAWLSRSPLPLPQSPRGSEQLAAPAGKEDGRRQVQFATPGGTRIIWVFDPSFDVR